MGVDIPSAVAIRDVLVRLSCNDLLGPAGGPEEETLANRVHERYVLGMFAPWEGSRILRNRPPDPLSARPESF